MFEYLEHAKDIEVRKEIKMSRDMLQNKYNFTVEYGELCLRSHLNVSETSNVLREWWWTQFQVKLEGNGIFSGLSSSALSSLRRLDMAIQLRTLLLESFFILDLP